MRVIALTDLTGEELKEQKAHYYLCFKILPAESILCGLATIKAGVLLCSFIDLIVGLSLVFMMSIESTPSFIVTLLISRVAMIPIALLSFYGIKYHKHIIIQIYFYIKLLEFIEPVCFIIWIELNIYGILFEIFCLLTRIYFSYILFSYNAIIKDGNYTLADLGRSVVNILNNIKQKAIELEMAAVQGVVVSSETTIGIPISEEKEGIPLKE
jgi:hypothetical protein